VSSKFLIPYTNDLKQVYRDYKDSGGSNISNRQYNITVNNKVDRKPEFVELAESQVSVVKLTIWLRGQQPAPHCTEEAANKQNKQHLAS